MQVVIIGSESSQQSLTGSDAPGLSIHRVETPEALAAHAGADVVVDLLFENDAARIALLRKLSPALVVINSVVHTLAETDGAFVRINGWPGFLSGKIIEAAALDAKAKEKTEAFFSLLGKEIAWLPDEPGFVTPRVISAIINEAFLAVAEGVSTEADIDTAMKLGTNYPYGPFEWAEKIGLRNIRALSQKRSEKNTSPADSAE